MIDESECNCAKFVLKAVLDGDHVAYSKGGLAGIKVPAFGGGELQHLTSVEEMKNIIDGLEASHKATAIRKDNPKVGDLMFWSDVNPKTNKFIGHIAIVTAVSTSKTNGDIVVLAPL